MKISLPVWLEQPLKQKNPMRIAGKLLRENVGTCLLTFVILQQLN